MTVMLEILRKMWRSIIFLVIITSVTADETGQQKSRLPNAWEPLMMKINEATAPDEKLYKYVFMIRSYGSDLSMKNVVTYHYRQTNCSKTADENISNCVLDPKGKVALCESNTNTVNDLSACKFIGDKIFIPSNDRRSQECAIKAVGKYNREHYSKSNKSLSKAVIVATNVVKEMLEGGFRCAVKFSTQEIICQDDPGPNNETSRTCEVTSPRIDCSAWIAEPFYRGSMVGLVKCQVNKNPNAIAAMKTNNTISVFIQKSHSLITYIKPGGSRGWESQSLSSSTSVEWYALKPESSDLGFKVEQTLNKQPGQEFLFKYLWRQTFFGDNVEREMFYEVYLQESECKASEQQKEQATEASQKDDATQKTMPATESCKTKPTGKVAVCKVKDSFEDVSACKFTGDKYELAKEDRRSFDLVTIFIKHDNKNKDGYSEGLSSFDFLITSPIQSEVTNTGTKHVLRFSTKLKTVTKETVEANGQNSTGTKNITTEERVDCEGPVEVLMPAENETKCGFKSDVKCVPSKDRLPPQTLDEDLETLIFYRLKSNHTRRSRKLYRGVEKEDGEQVTTMSSDGDGNLISKTHNDHVNVKDMAKKQQKELNNVAKEFLYKFVVDTRRFYASEDNDFMTKSLNYMYLENLFQETTCKKAEAKNAENCTFNPKGKIVICKYPGISACKFSGDKYELDKNDEYVMGLVFDAAHDFSNQNYPRNGSVILTGHSLESSVQFEILNDGIKSSFKFNASEENCPTGNENKTMECVTIKLDIHCEATITMLVDHATRGKLKFVNDVKCPDLQPADKKSVDNMNEKKRSPSKPKRSKKRRGSAKQQKHKP